MPSYYWNISGLSGPLIRVTLRTFQIIFALIVAALYGVDLQHATKTHTKANSAWVYAEVVASLSILTCTVHLCVTITRIGSCVWDWVVFLLWVSQFGVFAAIYIGGKSGTDKIAIESVSRMQAAVWIDMVNMLLWLGTAGGGIVWCCTERRARRRIDRMKLDEEAADASGDHRQSHPGEVDKRVVARGPEMFNIASVESRLKGGNENSMKHKVEDIDGESVYDIKCWGKGGYS
ncbi:uncharacterized protein BP5553_02483 [Venustampulla echinocandica]|uniref:MARVEL domain-containing protein n=1 Tax=Venustampulla echinocandica TaxID=2656787 RepID=A0A370U408_9HELO|nr:uncharacterized protein BP5553_02483 [Venustampulla echinocandica]RDL42504.1 hypothetical protein BP5553_02483 [Venustampulla echinocandica]